LAPEDASAYAVRGYLRFVLGWDWRGALADFERSLKINGADHVTLRRYSTVLAGLGRVGEATAIATRAADLDPLSGPTWSIKGLYAAVNGQFDIADDAFNHGLELIPNGAGIIEYLAGMRLTQGRFADALAVASRLPDGPARLQMFACAQWGLGHSAESSRALEDLKSRYGPISPFRVAWAYSCRGDLNATFAWMDRAFTARDDGLPRNLKGAMQGAAAAFKVDPRYAALLRRMDFPP
jgi:tetratricopeptide (TPR) repeat protein